jgi:hypothetical protein
MSPAPHGQYQPQREQSKNIFDHDQRPFLSVPANDLQPRSHAAFMPLALASNGTRAYVGWSANPANAVKNIDT